MNFSFRLLPFVKFIRAHETFTLFLISFCSLLYGMQAVVFHPNLFLLYDKYDQMRNYYAYLYYLKQPFSLGLFRFTGMNYPYGDFIFYTDNTPLIAIFVKLFSHYIIDVGPYALPIYNWFILISIPISAVLAFKILNNFSSNQFINWIASLCFAWTNPQTVSNSVNLSLSMVVLTILLLLINIFKHQNDRRFFINTFFLAGLLIISCFIHIYYLAVLGFYSSIFFFAWGFSELLHKKPFIRIWIAGLFQFIISFGVSFLIIYLNDEYYLQRNKIAQGYDWIAGKLYIGSLYTAYPYFHIKFLFQSNSPISYNSTYYLGSFFLYLTTFTLILFILQSKYRLPVKALIVNNKYGNLLQLLLLTSIAGFFVSIGETYQVGIDTTFRNMLNPMVYLHWYTPMVTQFRVLARFAWIIFWVLNICGVIMVTYIWHKYKGIARYIIVFTLFFFLLFDAKNSMENEIHFHSNTPNHFEIGETQTIMNRLIKQIDVEKYQAVLPVPYFCVGTEDYSITIDPDDDFITACMIFSLQTGLPLMASSMGRTPPAFTQNELSLFINGTYNSNLKSAMNNKPILILYNTKYYADSLSFATWPAFNREPALTAFKNGKKIIERKHFAMLREEGDWKLYEASIDSL